MTIGLNTLPLFIITVFSVSLFAPAGLGTTRGSTLGFGTRDLISVVLGTASGITYGRKRLLSFTKVTEWGSPTVVGLIQFIDCPASIVTF
jgi:hypothetical protein